MFRRRDMKREHEEQRRAGRKERALRGGQIAKQLPKGVHRKSLNERFRTE
jgi:hypothetical protein